MKQIALSMFSEQSAIRTLAEFMQLDVTGGKSLPLTGEIQSMVNSPKNYILPQSSCTCQIAAIYFPHRF